jgi:hypothetical protein
MTKLYKFRPVNKYTRALLTKHEIFFPNAKQLNDPYDCAIKVSFDGGTQNQYREILRLALGKHLENLVLSNEKFNEIVEVHLKIQMQNQTQFVKDIEQGFFESVKSTKGIFCLSETNDSVLMWSHYAEKHSGICIEMGVPEISNSAVKVNYVEELPTLNFFEHDQEDLAKLVLLSKQKQWAYEREWRIIDPAFPSGLHRLNKTVVSAIIFGSAISPDDEQQVRQWIKEGGIDVPYYRAKLTSHGKYMDIIEI